MSLHDIQWRGYGGRNNADGRRKAVCGRVYRLS